MDRRGQTSRGALVAFGLVALLSAAYLSVDDPDGGVYQMLDSSLNEPRHLLDGEPLDGQLDNNGTAIGELDDDDVPVVLVAYNNVPHTRRPSSYYATSELAEEEDVDAVVASIPGTWRPKPWCPVPRVIVLLYGQLRSFADTYRFHALMAHQASNDCYLVVAVTDEEICEADPHVPGKCLGVRGGGHLWWGLTEGVENVWDADKLLNSTRAAFQDNLFATVYQSRDAKMNYLEKVHYLWGIRLQAAVRNVHEAFATQGMPLDMDGTVVIRTRFDMLPLTFPQFPWDEDGGLQHLFRDQRNNTIIYAADFRDCQPDMHAYTSLRGMLDHLDEPFPGYSSCRASAEEPQVGPLFFDDDWNLCRRDLLRSTLNVELPANGLQPIPVGKNRRLYCDCMLEAGDSDDGFRCYNRFHYTFLYSARRTVFECPVAPADNVGGSGPVHSYTSMGHHHGQGCPNLPTDGPLGCIGHPCPGGHTHNVWYSDLA